MPLAALGGLYTGGADGGTSTSPGSPIVHTRPTAPELSTITSNDIHRALPELQTKVQKAISIFTQRNPGFTVVVNDVIRNSSDQKKAFVAGFSTIDGTKQVGKHNYYPSMAIDLNIRTADGKKPGPKVLHTLYTDLGELAEEQGLRWGGRWTIPYDPYHFELPSRGPLSPPPAKGQHAAEAGDRVSFSRQDGTKLAGVIHQIIEPSALPNGTPNGWPTYLVAIDAPRYGERIIVVPHSQIKKQAVSANMYAGQQ